MEQMAANIARQTMKIQDDPASPQRPPTTPEPVKRSHSADKLSVNATKDPYGDRYSRDRYAQDRPKRAESASKAAGNARSARSPCMPSTPL